MSLLTTIIKSPKALKNKPNRDWPSHIPMPTDEDIAFMSEMSERNTGSCFFDAGKRSGKNGSPSSRDKR